MLTVGIGYPVGLDLAYVGTRRMYDLSPTSDTKQLESLMGSAYAAGEAKGGGAPLFIRFMIEELWPWITAHYDVSDDRTYVGDSMGGLFGCYTLFNHHGFFNRYVIGSPWICWDHPLVFDYEEQYTAAHDDLDAVVFLAAGGAEEVISPFADPAMAATFKVANTQEYTERLGSAPGVAQLSEPPGEDIDLPRGDALHRSVRVDPARHALRLPGPVARPAVPATRAAGGRAATSGRRPPAPRRRARSASSRSAVTRTTGSSLSAARAASVSSPCPGTWTTSTPPAVPASAPRFACPSSTRTTRPVSVPSTTARRTRSTRSRAAPGRSAPPACRPGAHDVGRVDEEHGPSFRGVPAGLLGSGDGPDGSLGS